jgi:colanic acid/amylovoran biosynthesis glycosyltransferase
MSVETARAAPERGRRLTVVHAIGRWLGPTETWLYNQITNLPPDRVATEVIAMGRHPDTPETFSGVAVSVFSDRRIRYRLRRLRDRVHKREFTHNEVLESRLRRGGVDLVHSHFGPNGWAATRVRGAERVAHLVTFYGYDVNWLPRLPEWKLRYRELFAAVDAVLCEGEAMADAIHRLGCPADKLRVHHLGVEVDAIEFRPRVRRPHEPVRLLMAARFFEKKGIPDALCAIGALRETTDVHVTIVGDDDGTPESIAEHGRIDDAVAGAELGDAVTFAGLRSATELFALAYEHDVFISPSRTSRDGDTEGGAPVAIIEMAASGMPVVATTHCDVPSVLAEPNRALLTPEGDVDALRAQLERLLAIPDWTELVAANRRHIERHYDVRRQGERLAGLYDEIVRAGAR